MTRAITARSLIALAPYTFVGRVTLAHTARPSLDLHVGPQLVLVVR